MTGHSEVINEFVGIPRPSEYIFRQTPVSMAQGTWQKKGRKITKARIPGNLQCNIHFTSRTT